MRFLRLLSAGALATECGVSVSSLLAAQTTDGAAVTGLRYFVPLLLFPFSDSPPAFTLLFLLSLVVLCRPCAYCTILIVLMALASCSFDNRCFISFNHGNLFSAINRTAVTPSVTSSLAANVTNLAATGNGTLFDRMAHQFATLASLFSLPTTPAPQSLSSSLSPPATAPSRFSIPFYDRIVNAPFIQNELAHFHRRSSVQQVSRGLYEVTLLGVGFRLRLFGP